MKGSLLMNKLTLPQNITSNKPTSKDTLPWTQLLVYAAIGCSFSLFSAFENFSPFAAAFLAIVPTTSIFAVLIGACAGYLHTFSTLLAFRYIASLLLICSFKLLFKKLRFQNESIITHCLVAFISFFSCGLIYLVLSEFSALSFVFLLAQSLTCVLFCMIFFVSLNSKVFEIELDELSPATAINLLLSSCAFVLCLSGFNIHYFSPARVLVCLALLFICNYKGLELACVVSIFLGITLFITPNFSHILACFVLACFVASLLSSFGSMVISIAFCGSFLAVCLFYGFDIYVFVTMIEVVLASFIFILIPPTTLHEVENVVQKTGLKPNDSVNREVCANLQRASQNINDVSKIVKNVSGKLDNIIDPEVDKLFSRIQQNVCSQCMEKSNCWNKNFDNTSRDVLSIAGIEPINRLKTDLQMHCMRQSELVNQIQLEQTDYMISTLSTLKVRELRNIVTDQFYAISQFLGEIALQASNSRVVDNAKSRSIKSVLKEHGIFVDSLKYFTNHNSKVSIEITMIDSTFEIDTEQVRQILQTTLKMYFQKAEIGILELRTTITFDEKALYKVQVGCAQIASTQDGSCGDHVGRVSGINGNEIALLSDGMGTGSRAAIDGSMTATLMEKFLSCGFSFDSAITMVNSALIVKSSDESMCTIDAVSFNTYNGMADFYKAGAAISFIRQNKNISIVEQNSLAVGILRKVKFAHCSYQLDFGDIILLVSDGVTAVDSGWINDELLAWSTNNMNDLATHIANLTKLRCEGMDCDDITAVAIKVLRN